ncbi:radical SAM protein [Acetatifactor muris]|uniref:Radical SAM core domain-containing protein n=1 Tax=Acetatifactor muris TaxID=879566 RepID=A0A2K4ZK21_9FIRM|nr:radical SAM protein [Acetatifactor muris]MCR2049038.1 radical SAM protein [Acetatifactor muris]SOY30819.1 hypothetical protein AMURIS_03550 [Acetatifactor muris]
MKESRFNLAYCNEEYYVVLNTKTSHLIRFPVNQKEIISEILQQKSTLCDLEIHRVLAEKGFIVEDSTNELDEIYRECYELVNSKVLYLTVMPTYTCNLACIYCFQHHIPGAIINDNTMKNIIYAVEKNIGKYSALYVEWFGGEPLIARRQVIYMNQKFKEICNRVRIPYAARITTNGYYLDRKTFEQLFKNNCFIYYISVDGGKDLHNRQRPCRNGEGSYDVIMANLKQIKQEVSSRNFRIEIRVNCSKRSYDYLEQFLKEFEVNFGNDSRFSVIIETVNDWSERTVQMNNEGQLMDHSDLSELGKIAKRYNINLASIDKHLLKTQICQAAKRNGYSIFYDGTIHKCQMALESEKYCQMDKIGKVTDDGEFQIEKENEKIWVSDIFPKSCENCKVLPMCLGKKCVFQKEIQGQPCIDIENKFLNAFMLYDSSKIDMIPLYTIGEKYE